jgi:hypothetical protein
MTKLDRCERCGAEALHRFAIDWDRELELLFCQHHTTEYLPELLRQGFVTVESKELVST